MNEKAAYRAFRRALPPFARCDRIENVVCAGMPDVSLCLNGVEWWIEFKAPTEPRRAGTPLFGSNHKILPTQIAWFTRCLQAGGNCGVLISTDKRWIFIEGQHVPNLNSMPVADICARALWTSNRKNVLWKNLFISLNSKPALTPTN